MKSIFLLLFISMVFVYGCKPDQKVKTNRVYSEELKKETDVYVCPMECDNGMNYYLEGKCDICHINLIKE